MATRLKRRKSRSKQGRLITFTSTTKRYCCGTCTRWSATGSTATAKRRAHAHESAARRLRRSRTVRGEVVSRHGTRAIRDAARYVDGRVASVLRRGATARRRGG